jgi:hypothetical protein
VRPLGRSGKWKGREAEPTSRVELSEAGGQVDLRSVQEFGDLRTMVVEKER